MNRFYTALLAVIATMTMASQAQAETRFYFFRQGTTLPAEVNSIDLRNEQGTSIQWNNLTLIPDTTDFAYIKVANSWFSFNQNLLATTDMSAVKDGYFVLKFRSNLACSDQSNAFNIRLNNDVSYQLRDAQYFDGNWHTLVYKIADAANHPVYTESMSGTQFQLHTDGLGEGYIAIDVAYLTDDTTHLDAGTAGTTVIVEPEEIPEQDNQRIYLRKGSAVTPDGVAETDYSETSFVTSEWENCTPSSEFLGITTQEQWWFNFQLKNNAMVDLSPVYRTWRMVVCLRSDVVENGTDRGLSINLGGNAKEFNLVTTYADSAKFVVKELPLDTVLSGAKHLSKSAAGATVVTFSSGNNNAAGRTIQFDYIYFTNEKDTGTDIRNTDMPQHTLDTNAPFYDLLGRRVDTSYRGVVLQNGQKYILQ